MKLTKGDIGFVNETTILIEETYKCNKQVIEVARLREAVKELKELKEGHIAHDGSYVAWSDVKKRIDEVFGEVVEG